MLKHEIYNLFKGNRWNSSFKINVIIAYHKLCSLPCLKKTFSLVLIYFCSKYALD